MKLKILIVITCGVLMLTGCLNKEAGASRSKFGTGKIDKTPYKTSECLKELNSGADIKLSKIDKILVIKSERKLYTYRDGQVVDEYPISLGKNWDKGIKIAKGDYKTPEGIYKVVRKKCDDRLYRNLLISYPNSADIARSKAAGQNPGSLITIHGQPKWNSDGHSDTYTLQNNWTEGCVALGNEAMGVLWESATLGVEVEIRP